MTEPTNTDTSSLPAPAETVFENNLVLTCQVEGCLKGTRYGTGFEGPEGFERARQSFRDHHLIQHTEGRAPDVWVTTTYSFTCSVCGKHITVEDADPDEDRLWCWNCGASWTTYGSNGRTDLPDPNNG